MKPVLLLLGFCRGRVEQEWPIFNNTATLHVSSYQSNGGEPLNAFDGDYRSFWMSGAKQSEVKIVFNAMEPVSAVMLRKKGDSKYKYKKVCVEVIQL